MSLIGDPPGTLSRAETVLASLDDEQRAAAEAVTGPVCILAGAGTGKTRTITHRIAYGVHTGVYVPEQVLAVTFTARAAGELRGRLAALDVGGVQARTFHAAAMRQLRYFAPRVLGGPMPSLVENKLRLVATAASRSRLSTDRTSLRDLASEIEWAKTTLATPDDYPVRAKAAGVVDDAHVIGEIGEVLAGRLEGRRSAEEVTVYKSPGHIAQDLASAWALYCE